MPTDLSDSDGNQITTSNYYTIKFSDGTELGSGPTYLGQSTCGPVGSNQGAIFQYVRVKGDTTNAYGWPQGDVGYLRGLRVGVDGVQELSLSDGTPGVLTWHVTGNDYGFTAKQTTGNRAALYAVGAQNRSCGLRISSLGCGCGGKKKLMVQEDVSLYGIPLDCTFVKMALPFKPY